MTAHHGMGMQHTGMEPIREVYPPAAADAIGMQETQPTPRSMIGVDHPSMRMAHSQMGYVDMMQEANMYGEMGMQQGHYTRYNTMHMQPHLMRGHTGPMMIRAGRPTMAGGVFRDHRVIPPLHPVTSMHSWMPQGEMMH